MFLVFQDVPYGAGLLDTAASGTANAPAGFNRDDAGGSNATGPRGRRNGRGIGCGRPPRDLRGRGMRH